MRQSRHWHDRGAGTLTGIYSEVLRFLVGFRHDIVDACRGGQFHVYAVDTIHEALGLFTGIEPGRRDDQGSYPEGSVLHRALARAKQYWEMAIARNGGSG